MSIEKYPNLKPIYRIGSGIGGPMIYQLVWNKVKYSLKIVTRTLSIENYPYTTETKFTLWFST